MFENNVYCDVGDQERRSIQEYQDQHDSANSQQIVKILFTRAEHYVPPVIPAPAKVFQQGRAAVYQSYIQQCKHQEDESSTGETFDQSLLSLFTRARLEPAFLTPQRHFRNGVLFNSAILLGYVTLISKHLVSKFCQVVVMGGEIGVE